MEIQESFLKSKKAEIQKKRSTGSITGVHILWYEIKYDSNNVGRFFNGGVYFGHKDVRVEAKFMKVLPGENAEEIFRLNSKVSHNHLLRPLMYTFVKEPPVRGPTAPSRSSLVGQAGFDCIAFERFDYHLAEWLETQSQGRRQLERSRPDYILNGALSYSWQMLILNVVDCINVLHHRNVYHGHLDDINNYVFCGYDIKIVHAKGFLHKAQNPIALRLKDFSDFGKLLNSVLTPGLPCVELERFISYISTDPAELKYGLDRFVEKIRSHPFLKTPRLRMVSLSEVSRLAFRKELSVGRSFWDSDSFEDFQDWNAKYEEFPEYLQHIYDHGNMNARGPVEEGDHGDIHDEGDHGDIHDEGDQDERVKPYTGSAYDLHRFIRNAFQHCRRHVGIDVLDHHIRTLFSGFMEAVHENLWSADF